MSSVSRLVALGLSIGTAAAVAQPAHVVQASGRPRLPDISLVIGNAARPDAPALLGLVDVGGIGAFTFVKGRRDGGAPNDRFSHLLSISLDGTARVDAADARLPSAPIDGELLAGALPAASAIGPLRLLAGAAVLLLLAWRRRRA